MKTSDGSPFVKGKDLTAFSNSEEEGSALMGVIPFALESKLVASHAYYSKSADYICHSVAAGRLITGQNPASAGAVVKKMLALQKEVVSTRPEPQPY
jgi:putative intracellular protease/amidase